MSAFLFCLSILALSWSVAGLAFAYKQYRDADFEVREDDEDDAEAWKK